MSSPPKELTRKERRRAVSFSLATGSKLQLEVETIPSNVRLADVDTIAECTDTCFTVWDTKSLKKPLFVAENLPSQNPETNLIFSPDEKFLLTGTAGAQAGVLAGSADEERAREAKASGKEGGKVVILRRDGLEVVRSLSASSSS